MSAAETAAAADPLRSGRGRADYHRGMRAWSQYHRRTRPQGVLSGLLQWAVIDGPAVHGAADGDTGGINHGDTNGGVDGHSGLLGHDRRQWAAEVHM